MAERQVDILDHEDSDHDYRGIYFMQQGSSFAGVDIGSHRGTSLDILIDEAQPQLGPTKMIQLGSFDFDTSLGIETLTDSGLDLRLTGPEPPGMISVDRPMTSIEDIALRKVVPGGGG